MNAIWIYPLAALAEIAGGNAQDGGGRGAQTFSLTLSENEVHKWDTEWLHGERDQQGR